MNRDTASGKAGHRQALNTHLKEKWIARGLSEEKYDESQVRNALYHAALEQGQSKASVQEEFQNASLDQLKQKYGPLLPTDSPFRAECLPNNS